MLLRSRHAYLGRPRGLIESRYLKGFGMVFVERIRSLLDAELAPNTKRTARDGLAGRLRPRIQLYTPALKRGPQAR